MTLRLMSVLSLIVFFSATVLVVQDGGTADSYDRLLRVAAHLRFEENTGYLRSVLQALDIESQLVVFSPTSSQARLIRGNPVTNFSSPTFGRIVSAGDPRIMQFAVKYLF